MQTRNLYNPANYIILDFFRDFSQVVIRPQEHSLCVISLRSFDLGENYGELNPGILGYIQSPFPRVPHNARVSQTETIQLADNVLTPFLTKGAHHESMLSLVLRSG